MGTLMIKNGYLFDQELPFEQSDILVEDSIISRIGPKLDGDADRIVDARGKVVMPGLIDAHTHTDQALSRGLIDNLPLEPWLIFTTSGKEMSARELYVSAAVEACELVRSGTTGVFDNPFFLPGELRVKSEALIQAFVDVGLRAVVAPMITDRDTLFGYPFDLAADPTVPHSEKPIPSIGELDAQLRDFLAQWAGTRHSRISLVLSTAGPTYASEAWVERMAELASEYGLGLHTHLLETKAELMTGLKRFSMSTVEWLERVGWLGPRSSFAHGVWLNDNEIGVLARAGCTVIHSPVSNLKLGSGIAPVQAMRAAGLNVALGSDDPSCNDSANMFEVLKLAALLHKLYGPYDCWLGAADALDMCWTGGAKLMEQKVGALRPGYLADLTILGTDRLFMTPKESFANQLVFGELGASVEMVIIDGRMVVEDGRVVTVDERQLHAEAQALVDELYATDFEMRARALSRYEGVLKRSLREIADTPIGFSRLLS